MACSAPVTRPRGVTLVNRYSLTHVSDSALLRDLRSLLARERAATAELLTHLAEVDERRLYAEAGYPSMFAWCVGEFHLSEEAAFKRIRSARVARQHPAVFAMLADGDLHLSAVVMLAAYLTPENAAGLLAAARHQTKAGLERLLAERFPRPDLPLRIESLHPAIQLVPGRVGTADPRLVPERVEAADFQLSPGTVKLSDTKLSVASFTAAPSHETARSRVAPLSPGRFGLQFTVGQETHEKLRYAQALLGHAVPTGNLGQVLDRALDALIARLERRRFAATSRPRRPGRQRRDSANPRHVPAEVRRAVWQRDGGQCTFVSEAGHRCPARTRLEFDHIEPVARGGHATVKGMRLRCRTHNQYAAEKAFGAGFMARKREAAQRETEAERARAAAEAEAARARVAAADEVVPWLRALGLRLDEARRAAATCESIPGAPLEERVRLALRCSARPPQGCAAQAPRRAP
jgi:5-methylcytosine-specific restriction endonuclease McrA